MPPEICMQELVFLTHLTQMECSASPKVLAWAKTFQNDRELIPHGFLIVSVMEKLPGKSLENYWDYSKEERARIRDAFRESLMYGQIHQSYRSRHCPLMLTSCHIIGKSKATAYINLTNVHTMLFGIQRQENGTLLIQVCFPSPSAQFRMQLYYRLRDGSLPQSRTQ